MVNEMKVMKKLIFAITITIISVAVFCPDVNAADIENGQMDALGVDELEKNIPKSAEEMLGDVRVKDVEDADSALRTVKETLKKNLKKIFSGAIQTGSTLVAVTLLTAVVTIICPQGNGKYESYIEFAGVLSIAVVTAGGTSSLMQIGSGMLAELYAFSKALLPTLSAAAAAGGAVNAAASQYAAASLFMDILLTIGNELMIPLVYGYLMTAICGAALDNKGLASVASMIKWVTVTIMTAAVLSLTVYLTVTGTVLGTADDAVAKVAKTAISTSLPIIGSIASDASSAVVGGINTLKNIIGVFGLIIVVAVCTLPVLELAANSAVIKIASAFTETLGNKKVAGAMSAVGNAYAMILGVCGSAAIALFVSIISVLRTVTGI